MTAAIRPLSGADATAFAALRLEGIRLFPNAFLLTEEEAAAISLERVEASLSRGGFFGAFAGATLVAFIAQHAMGFKQTAHRVEIGPLYVTPAHHGTGVAGALMRAALSAAKTKGALQAELSVAAPNMAARALYTDHGFETVGLIRKAVTHCDDVAMWRDLTQDPPARSIDGLHRLTPADWRSFNAIRTAMLRDDPTNFGTSAEEWAAMAPDEIAALLRTLHMFAVVEEGRILSCLGWQRLPGAVQAHRGRVVAVYTLPEARRRGHFGRLLTAAIEDAKAHHIAQFELEIAADNPVAQTAYESRGFTVTGGIPRALNHSGVLSNQLYMVMPL